MGFGGKDGCVQGGDSVVAGGCDRPMFGECPFHPGHPVIHCPLCDIKCGNPACESGSRVDSLGKWCLECLLKVSVAATKDKKEKDKEEYEYVDHPKHYNMHPSGIECIDVIEHMTHNVGAAIKYLWRAGLKPGEADLRDFDKAIWYINREKERLAKAKQK